MSIKEYVTRALETLNDEELQQVAEYVAFLKFRAHRSRTPTLDSTQFTALYAEFVDEDRALAEEGIAEYHTALQAEDAG